jgi:methyl-accepting chemotaxis protein
MNFGSLKWRLISLGLIPVCAFMVLSGATIVKAYRNYREAVQLSKQLHTVEKASLAVHELQKERGLSASYLSGANVKGKLEQQRKKASARLAELSADLKIAPYKKEVLNELQALVDQVPQFRKKVDSRAFKVPEAVKNYTAVVSRFIRLGNDVSEHTSFSDVATDLRTLAILESAKENGGILRAVVSGVLARNKPISPSVVKKILKLKGGLESNLVSRGLSLDKSSLQTLEELMASNDWKTVGDTVLHVVANAEVGDYYRDSSAFFAMISKNLDVAGGVLKDKRDAIISAVHAQASTEGWTLFGNLGFLFFALVGISVILYWNSSTLSLQLSALAKRLDERSESLAEVSGQVMEGSQALSSSAVQQASSLQETVSSADEISAMVSRNATSAADSSEKSAKSRIDVEKASESIERMLKAIREISDSNRQVVNELNSSNDEIAGIVKVIREIGEKTNIINDIVFQTKLLSFNASVEAARAGEHGKGFAVVAEEVGNLATMSGDAANEISEMLNSSIHSVESIVKRTQSRVQSLSSASTQKIDAGVKTAEECAERLDQIGLSVEEVDVLTQDISKASSEQSLGLNEITSAMSELDNLTQQNTGMAQDTARFATNLKTQSEHIHNLVDELSALLGQRAGKRVLSAEQANGGLKNRADKAQRDMGDNVTLMPELDSRPNPKAETKTELKKAAGDDSLPDWDDPGFEEV